MSKNYLLYPLNETLIWRKIVAARTTYFIRYKDLPLRRQRGIQLLNGTKKKSVTEEELGPFDPRFRKPMLYPTELLSLIGAKEAKRTDIAPKCLPL